MNHLAKVHLHLPNFSFKMMDGQSCIYLMKIDDAINKLPENVYKGFRNHCVKFYNERYV
jgi:hypothetical protein